MATLARTAQHVPNQQRRKEECNKKKDREKGRTQKTRRPNQLEECTSTPGRDDARAGLDAMLMIRSGQQCVIDASAEELVHAPA